MGKHDNEIIWLDRILMQNAGVDLKINKIMKNIEIYETVYMRLRG